MVADCIKEALIEVSTSAAWNSLRETVTAASWSGDRATLTETVYRVQGVNWYSSPTGSPASTYDYPRYPIEFITMDEYLKFPLVPYTGATNRPQYWTLQNHYITRVNPYPNDATERGKITFDVFKVVAYPASDSTTFTCSDQFLNLVQYKASALLALKFLSDANMAQIFDGTYDNNKRKLLVSDTYPSGGYTIFRGGRR
jgi:hypothetical protein